MRADERIRDEATMRRTTTALILALSLAPISGCRGLGADHTPIGNEEGSPAGQILFVGTLPSGRTDLYLIDQTGQTLTSLTGQMGVLDEGRTITTTSETSLGPVPSEDGQRVLFTLQRPGGASRSLYELEVFGGGITALGEAPAGLRRAFYDRTGERILLDVRDPDSGEGHLSLWTDGGPEDLSPDGEELLFDAFFPDDDRLLVRVGSGEARRLAVLDLGDGSLAPFATSGGLELLAPRLSPDGGAVVFQGRGDPNACYDLFEVTIDGADGAGLKAPTPLGAAAAAWDSLYGDLTPPGDHSPDDDGDAEAQDEDAPPVVAGFDTTECLSVSAPSWAPDGSQRIAFLATSDTERADAFILDLSTGATTAVSADVDADGPGVTASPRWSPTGAWLLFSVSWSGGSGDGSHVDLFVSDGQSVPVSLTDGYNGVPSLAHWDATGERLLFWSRSSAGETSSGSSDAVVVDVAGGQITAVTAGQGLHAAYPLWLDRNSLYY